MQILFTSSINTSRRWPLHLPEGTHLKHNRGFHTRFHKQIIYLQVLQRIFNSAPNSLVTHNILLLNEEGKNVLCKES